MHIVCQFVAYRCSGVKTCSRIPIFFFGFVIGKWVSAEADAPPRFASPGLNRYTLAPAPDQPRRCTGE